MKSFHKGKNVMLFATNQIVGLSRAFDLRLLIDAKNAYLVYPAPLPNSKFGPQRANATMPIASASVSSAKVMPPKAIWAIGVMPFAET